MSEINELDSLTSFGKPNAPHRTLIYAQNGTGKSTFCSKHPGVYFLPTEDGVNNIKVAQYKDQIKNLPTLISVIRALRDKKHPYLAVCLDSISATESLIIDAIEERLKKSKDPKAPKTISEMNDDFGSGYLAIANEWKVILNELDDLRYKRNMNILLTANAKTEKIENLEDKDYHKITIELFGSRSSKVITSWCDHVLFAKQDIGITSPSKYKVLANKGSLSLYTRQTASFFAKTRGEIPWPEKLPLDWDTFDRLRVLMGRYGAGIKEHLEKEFNSVQALIPIDSREKAKSVFVGLIERGQWHIADLVIIQAKEESGIQDLNSSNGAEESVEL